MDAAAKLERNSVNKHQIQPEYGDEQVDAGQDCRTRLERPNSQARTNGDRGKNIVFPVPLTTGRIGNLTGWLPLLYVCDDHAYTHIYTYIHISLKDFAEALTPRTRHYFAAECSCVCCIFGFVYQKTARDGLSSLLRDWVTEHSVCSILTGMLGAFPAYLPLISFCGPPLLFVSFQVNNGSWHFLDYVQDLSGGSLCPLVFNSIVGEKPRVILYVP